MNELITMDKQLLDTQSLYAIYRWKTYTDITLIIRDNYVKVILHSNTWSNNRWDIHTDLKRAKVFIK